MWPDFFQGRPANWRVVKEWLRYAAEVVRSQYRFVVTELSVRDLTTSDNVNVATGET